MITYSLYQPEGKFADGDLWKSPKGHSPSFERVMTADGWIDAQESNGEQITQPETEQRLDNPEVPLGTNQPSQGDGDDGEMPPSTFIREEDTSVGEGVDGNTPDVV